MSNNFIRLADRVKEISYTTGTGNLSLNGAVAGFSSFRSALKSSTANVFYAVTNGSLYEIGSGVYVSGIQDYIIRFPFNSSNNNNVVSLPEGVKEVYITYPATHSVYNGSGLSNFANPQNSGIAFWQSPNMLNYDSNIIWSRTNSSLGINTNNPQYGIHVGGTGPSSLIRASGLNVGGSGIYFPPANDGDINYLGGRQLTHYEKNQLDQHAYNNSLIDQLTGSNAVLQLSGVSNQYILFKKQGAGTVFAGPPSGCTPPCSPGYPSFRPLTEEDIPDLSDIYASDSDIHNVSGALNDKITASNNLSSSISGILNSKIDSVSGTLTQTSIILRSDLTATSGTLRNDLTTASGALRNDIITVSGLTVLNNPNATSNFACGRLTLESNVPASTTDQIGKTVLYYTPYNGNTISLYTGSQWSRINFNQVSLSIGTLIANRNYDVFGFINNNTLALELSSVWLSDNTTRANSLVLQDGIYCKSGDLTRRYLGTIRTTSTTTVEDSFSKRFVWNVNNKILREVYKSTPNNTSWTYGSSPWRALNATNYNIEIINGLNENSISLQAGILHTSESNASVTFYHIGISKDLVSTPLIKTRTSAWNTNSQLVVQQQLNVNLIDIPTIGYHYYYPSESTIGNKAPTLYGGDNDNFFGGIFGLWEC